MRRLATAVVVGGIVLLALLAVADAFRGSSVESAAPGATSTIHPRGKPTLTGILRRDQIAGQLIYSDQECILHSLVLPGMVDEIVRHENGQGVFHFCRFTIAAGRFTSEPPRADPRTARRPGGGVTSFRNGEILLAGREALYSQADLRQIARRHPNIGGLGPGVSFRVSVTDLTWLDHRHLVASLRIRVPAVEPQYLAVLLNGKTVVSLATRFGQPLTNWVVSPAGSLAASEDGTIMSRTGGSTDPPRNLPDGRAVAFSPDEQWLAYVTSNSVYLIGTPRNSEPGRVIRLAVPAQDLIWEPAGAGATDTSTTAR
jgi:hypothetical protein